jgi:pimeloyl-ACP methyl ester carboxylesterase
MKALTITNRRKQRLAAVLHGELGELLVISCHGMLSGKDGTKHRLLAEALSPELPVLRFDFAGRGESEGSLFDMSYSSQVEDLLAVLDWAGAQGVERIGLFGSSMGGAVALLAAARDERVVAIATLAAVAHPELIDERHPEAAGLWHRQGYIDTPEGKLGKGFYDDSLSHDVISAVRILHAPLHVVHGEEDDVVPSSDAHDIASAARAAALDLVPGAGHRFDEPQYLRPVIRGVVEFFCAQLKG